MSLAFDKRALQKVQRNILYICSTGIRRLDRLSWRWSRNLDLARGFQRRYLTIDELNRHKKGMKTPSYCINFSYKTR